MDRLQVIKQRYMDTSPGDWTVEQGYDGYHETDMVIEDINGEPVIEVSQGIGDQRSSLSISDRDKDFINNVKQDMFFLIDELERCRSYADKHPDNGD